MIIIWVSEGNNFVKYLDLLIICYHNYGAFEDVGLTIGQLQLSFLKDHSWP